MTKREPLMTEKYFDQDIRWREEVLVKQLAKFRDKPEQYTKLEIVYYNLFLDAYQLLISKYSRGYDVTDLKKDFTDVVTYWEQYMNHPDHEELIFKNSKEDYEIALWLLSIGILVKADESTIDRLIAGFGNEADDMLFQQLISKYKKRTQKSALDDLMYPKIYTPLYDATTTDRDSAPKEVKLFLKNWYGKMKSCYWYATDKGRIGPDGKHYEDAGFFGYWCFEAAAVTYLWDLDDSTYRDMKYYPKDMVDFARER